jgi:hypothetical protein
MFGFSVSKKVNMSNIERLPPRFLLSSHSISYLNISYNISIDFYIYTSFICYLDKVWVGYDPLSSARFPLRPRDPLYNKLLLQLLITFSLHCPCGTDRHVKRKEASLVSVDQRVLYTTSIIIIIIIIKAVAHHSHLP